MKKLILTTLICLFVFSNSSNANSLESETKTVAITKFGSTVNSFCKLIQMGDYDAVKALIESGEDVNQKSTGLTPLMFAARYNKSKIAQLLIDNGADLKIKSDKYLKMTALQIAKQSKAKDVIKVIKAAYRK